MAEWFDNSYSRKVYGNSYSREVYGDNCFYGDKANKRMHRMSFGNNIGTVINNYFNCCGHKMNFGDGLKFGLGYALASRLMGGIGNMLGGCYSGGYQGMYNPYGYGQYTQQQQQQYFSPFALFGARRPKTKVKTVVKEVVKEVTIKDKDQKSLAELADRVMKLNEIKDPNELQKAVKKLEKDLGKYELKGDAYDEQNQSWLDTLKLTVERYKNPLYLDDIDNSKIADFAIKIAEIDNNTTQDELDKLKADITEALENTDENHKADDARTYANLRNIVDDIIKNRNALANTSNALNDAQGKIKTNNEIINGLLNGDFDNNINIIDTLTMDGIAELINQLNNGKNLPNEVKEKLIADLKDNLEELENPQGSEQGNYKFTLNNRLLSQLGLLCKLDSTITVGVLTREQSLDKWILGSISNVKIDKTGDVSWTVDNSNATTNNRVKGVYNFSTTGCSATVESGDPKGNNLTTGIQYQYNPDGYFENKTNKPTVGL